MKLPNKIYLLQTKLNKRYIGYFVYFTVLICTAIIEETTALQLMTAILDQERTPAVNIQR